MWFTKLETKPTIKLNVICPKCPYTNQIHTNLSTNKDFIMQEIMPQYW